MGTSHSNVVERQTCDDESTDDEQPTVRYALDSGTLTLPATATDAEAAAIVASISSHLQQEAAAGESAEPNWDGKRWAFAGRMRATLRTDVRVPLNAPTDPWTAANRSDLF